MKGVAAFAVMLTTWRASGGHDKSKFSQQVVNKSQSRCTAIALAHQLAHVVYVVKYNKRLLMAQMELQQSASCQQISASRRRCNKASQV